MRVFTTTETCDECEKGAVTLYEVDVARLLELVDTYAQTPIWSPSRLVAERIRDCIRVTR